MIAKHEGLRLRVYRCPAGKLTIGYGRNLEDLGITKKEADGMLENDILRCFNEAKEFAWFDGLDAVRQDVVISMIFNLGLHNFATFKKMIAAIAAKNYEMAAEEMNNSFWAGQVGARARELSEIMRTGKYQSS